MYYHVTEITNTGVRLTDDFKTLKEAIEMVRSDLWLGARCVSISHSNVFNEDNSQDLPAFFAAPPSAESNPIGYYSAGPLFSGLLPIAFGADPTNVLKRL